MAKTKSRAKRYPEEVRERAVRMDGSRTRRAVRLPVGGDLVEAGRSSLVVTRSESQPAGSEAGG
jgi:hypothetical protein